MSYWTMASLTPERFQELLEAYLLDGSRPSSVLNDFKKRGFPEAEASAFKASLPLQNPTAFGLPDIHTGLRALKDRSWEDTVKLLDPVTQDLYPEFDIRIRYGNATWTMEFSWTTGPLPAVSPDLGLKLPGLDKIDTAMSGSAHWLLTSLQAEAHPVVSTLLLEMLEAAANQQS
jgi:hypothetical protein